MKQWIANYVKGCTTCQQNKNLTHRKKIPPYGITTTHNALPFQQVTMDLITGLPMSPPVMEAYTRPVDGEMTDHSVKNVRTSGSLDMYK